jgi:hypothetical protein
MRLLHKAAGVLERVALSLQAAFLTYGAMEPGTASLMAELLVRGCLYVHHVQRVQLQCPAVRVKRHGTDVNRQCRASTPIWCYHSWRCTLGTNDSSGQTSKSLSTGF